eukprot:TRINITY_DN9314_c0_g1_i1.p1 TRINITY_DN9314_c0_g1~~TRINITY_DN9314_c0_g1_i1.p1  ORF type:complete len:438 (+),score=101.40 TRINITY_DN9314_c0_g1_i1:65-1315(+)
MAGAGGGRGGGEMLTVGGGGSPTGRRPMLSSQRRRDDAGRSDAAGLARRVEHAAAALLPLPQAVAVAAHLGRRGAADPHADLVPIAEALGQSRPWSDRMEAMQKLQELMHGGAGADRGFIQVLTETALGPLCECVRDLRSQIVKEACATVQLMCSATSPALWAPMAAQLILALQHQLPVSPKVMADSAHLTVKYMVRFNRLDLRAIFALCDGAEHKNKVTRGRSLEHILLLLGEMPMAWLTDAASPPRQHYQQHASPPRSPSRSGEHAQRQSECVRHIQRAVERGVQDADPEARLMARLAACALGASFVPEGEQQQRMVREEKEVYDALVATGTLRVPARHGGLYRGGGPAFSPPPRAPSQGGTPQPAANGTPTPLQRRDSEVQTEDIALVQDRGVSAVQPAAPPSMDTSCRCAVL